VIGERAMIEVAERLQLRGIVLSNVAYGAKAKMTASLRLVCFTPESELVRAHWYGSFNSARIRFVDQIH
jgi:hypothetical protein